MSTWPILSSVCRNSNCYRNLDEPVDTDDSKLPILRFTNRRYKCDSLDGQNYIVIEEEHGCEDRFTEPPSVAVVSQEILGNANNDQRCSLYRHPNVRPNRNTLKLELGAEKAHGNNVYDVEEYHLECA